MEIVFDEPTHRYTVDGEEWPSVTTILGDMGLADYSAPWFRDEGYRIRGRLLHRGCALVARGLLDWDTTSPSLVPQLRGYEEFLKATGFKLDADEVPIASPRYRYAGTLDQLGNVSSERWLPDIKTGYEPPSTEIQLAMYAQAAEEYLGEKIDRIVTVTLPSGGGFKLPQHKNEWSYNRQLGISAASLWWWRKNNGLLKGKDMR